MYLCHGVSAMVTGTRREGWRTSDAFRHEKSVLPKINCAAWISGKPTLRVTRSTRDASRRIDFPTSSRDSHTPSGHLNLISSRPFTITGPSGTHPQRSHLCSQTHSAACRELKTRFSCGTEVRSTCSKANIFEIAFLLRTRFRNSGSCPSGPPVLR